MEKIDFVLLWVDGSDPQWLAEKNKYLGIKKGDSIADNRFRDWDNLKYWFRGVEKFAPWVNKIHFITYGHLPEWLNTENSKLNIVKHSEYIPKEYLPTFNSNVIELNLNRIPEISQHFVSFNDDMFICKKVNPDDFFKNGYPKDECVQNITTCYGATEQIAHAMLNNLDIINRNFSKREVMKKHFFKHINYKYGFRNFRTIFLLPWYAFSGFHNPHLPVSHLKSTYDTLWEKEKAMIEDTCKNRFRGYNDVTHWVMRYWNLCEGKFYPRESNFGKYFDASNNNKDIIMCLENQTSKIICINDSSTSYDFEKAKEEINTAFEKILPEKSSFER